MGWMELVLIGIGLSMDAFAVAICKGLNMVRIRWRDAALVALFFGGFQAIMPLIGWFLGSRFQQYIQAVDHWIAFGLLLFIGGQMVNEALQGETDGIQAMEDVLKVRQLFFLAVATSIDALAVGITFGVLEGTNIWLSITLIGCITFLLSLIGVWIGFQFGDRYEKKARICGGVILMLLGVKIVWEHLG